VEKGFVMMSFVKGLAVATFVGLAVIGRAEAQVESKAVATPAPKPTMTPNPLPPPKGKCIFPSSRALSAVIADDARKMYLKAGYKQALVAVRILMKKPVVSVLTAGNIVGIKGVAPQTGSPANLQITANPGGAPIELGCNAEAALVTFVVLVDSTGKRLNGRTTTKVIVQGAFS
jgi:hypothetical protein